MKIRTRVLNPFGILIESVNPYEKTNVQSIDIHYLKHLFNDYQLIILRGFNTFNSGDEFEKYCHSFGEVCIWPFGKVLNLKKSQNPKDHIFDHTHVPLHWDGMFRSHIPQYQIFHCLNAPLSFEGGKTIFSNTKMILNDLSKKVLEEWSQIKGTYERKMEYYHSKVHSNIVVKHPYLDYFVIRYNEPNTNDENYFINASSCTFTGSDQNSLKGFHKKIKEVLYSPKYCFFHQWKDGDVVIADNFSLLHGRERFQANSKRYIQRVQVHSDTPYENPHVELYQ